MNWLIHAGHGGVAAGHYFTPGKRSPEVPPGIYEGEVNRLIADGVWTGLDDEIILLNPGPISIPQREVIIPWVNKFYKKEKNTALIAIHCNASPIKGWSKANGFVVFHSRKASDKSKMLAKMLERNMRESGTGIKSRGIKQANHWITTQTKCPAVLLECGFMTNLQEAKKLARTDVQNMISDAIACTLQDYSEYYYG
jgi:N-acetylmuramoyl-L-alanine amidase